MKEKAYMLVDCDCDMKKLTFEEIQGEVNRIVYPTEKLIISLQDRLKENKICAEHFVLIMINSLGILSAALIRGMTEVKENHMHENLMPLINNITERCGIDLKIESVKFVEHTHH